MEAFVVDTPVLVRTVALLAGVVVAGWVVTRLRPGSVARLLAWALPVGGFTVMNLLTDDASAGFRMLALCGAVLYGMKAVVGVEAAASGDRPNATRWLAFALGWFGMRPAIFARRSDTGCDGSAELIRRGCVRIVQGATLVIAAMLLGPNPLGPWPPALLTMVGLSLVAHFGVFNVLAGFWRTRGYNTKALFRAPLVSTSLREFWGRRWNLAFSEMAAIAVFRPLRGRLGPGPSTTLAFLFSGVLHEIAISAPVRAGWGLPFAYFALHATLMRIEDALARRGRPIDRIPWVGRAWTLLWLGGPFPLLFHLPFQTEVVWPLFGA